MPDPTPLACRFGAFRYMVLLTHHLKRFYERCGAPVDISAIGGWWPSIFFQHMPYVRQLYKKVIREIDKLDKLSEFEVKKNLKKYKAEKVLGIFKKPEKYFEKYDSYKEIKELKKYCTAQVGNLSTNH